MSKYRFTIDAPPPNDPMTWYGTDLIEAEKLGIAEIEHEECVLVEKLGDDS